MAKNEYNFLKKIECIYIHIASRDVETLASLFLNKESATLENRIAHIRNHWLKNKKENYYPKRFAKEFKYYAVSLLEIDGSIIFKSANEFLNMPIEEFCNKIKMYAKNNSNFTDIEKNEYKYLYIFYKNIKDFDYRIDYYTIEYKEHISPNTVSIEAIVPQSKKELYKTDKFYGRIIYNYNKILLSFENKYININALFNEELSNNFSSYLVGVAISIADINQKIPIAKKVILSKKKFKNLNEIYLILNETEIIVADENLYIDTLSYLNNNHYLERYINKLKDFESFTRNISKHYFKKLYYQLAFSKFYDMNKTFELVKNNSSFTVKDRVIILKSLINSYYYNKFNKLKMVIPVLGKYYIFNHISEDAIKIKEALIELSKKVDIEIIFVVDNCNHKFTIEFSQFLNDIKESVKIYFANRENLEKDVNSLDFVYTDNRDFVIVKLIRATIQLFRFFSDELSIKEYEALFYKIKNRSIPYNDYFSDKKDKLCKNISPLMNKLSKSWNLYFYVRDEIVEYKLNINSNLSVEFFYQNNLHSNLHSIGNIINKEHQSIIILEGIDNKRVTSIVFDNYLYNVRDAFIVKIIGKEYESDKDVITIGICSSQAIELNSIKGILGNKRVCHSIDDIYNRLISYLRDNMEGD